MVITIDTTTVVAVGAALSVAGGGVLWTASQLAALRRLHALIKRVDGDTESDDPKARDGHAGRLSDVEDTVEAHQRFLRALARALRVAPTSDEHEIANAIRQALAEGRVAANDTGSHPALQIAPLPPPAPRHPTPYRGAPIRREEDDGE